MKICLECHTNFDCDDWQCPSCGKTPGQKDGFLAFAPSFSDENTGFEAGFFENLYALEKKNFWFRCRNKLIQWAMDEYCYKAGSFLEIGCGTGFVISGLKRSFPDTKYFGSEIFSTGLSYAKSRLPGVTLFQMDARNIPFREEFEGIGAFDVLEHIEEDEVVLSQIYKALKPGGSLLLTVPQHKFLWSKVDEFSCHKRRYSAYEIRSKARKVGFKILKTASFACSLVPFMALRKIRYGSTEFDPVSELKINPLIDILFERLLDMERTIVSCGLPLPAGGSILLVGKKEAA